MLPAVSLDAGAVSELMPARNFYIALHDRASDLLSFPYFVDEVDTPPARKALGRGLTEYVIRTGEPLLASPEVFEELVRRGEAELIGAPSVDWLGVPLRAAQETIGIVVVQSYTEGVRFRDSDRDLLAFERVANVLSALRQLLDVNVGKVHA